MHELKQSLVERRKALFDAICKAEGLTPAQLQDMPSAQQVDLVAKHAPQLEIQPVTLRQRIAEYVHERNIQTG